MSSQWTRRDLELSKAFFWKVSYKNISKNWQDTVRFFVFFPADTICPWIPSESEFHSLDCTEGHRPLASFQGLARRGR